LTDAINEVRLTITVPERTRDAADVMLEQFVPSGPENVVQRPDRKKGRFLK